MKCCAKKEAENENRSMKKNREWKKKIYSRKKYFCSTSSHYPPHESRKQYGKFLGNFHSLCETDPALLSTHSTENPVKYQG
jgi:hypothetical protein